MDKLKAKISKMENKRKAWRKGVAFVVLFFAFIVLGIGAAFAYLNARSGIVTNTFAAAEKYTLEYHDNVDNEDIAVPESQTLYITKTFNISSDVPDRGANYLFAGWNTKEDGSGTVVEPGNEYTATQNHTDLYAQWRPKGYKLTYDANGGNEETVPEEEFENTGDDHCTFNIASANSLTHPVEGKVFAGWATSPKATEPEFGNLSDGPYEGNVNNVTLDESITLYAPKREQVLYAVWLNKYEITFYPNEALGGYGNVPVLDPVITVEATHTFTIPAKTDDVTPTKDNYSWGWWGPEENVFEDGALENRQFGDTVILTEAKPKEDYYAYYLPSKDFTLTYNANGGSGLPTTNPARMSVTVADPTFKIDDREPTRSGYVFLGWAETKTPGEGDKIYKKDSEVFENRYYTFNRFISTEATLYAIWKPKVKYYVYFNFNRPNSDTYISGEEPSANGVFTCYSGTWKASSNGGRYQDERHISGETLEPSYTFTQTYWSTRGEYAVCEPDDGGEYEFLGWSADPNADEPTYTVDDNGFIQQDIEVTQTNSTYNSSNRYYLLKLYAVWRRTPKHAYRLIFVDTSNDSEVFSTDTSVANRISWGTQVRYYSTKNNTNGNPVTHSYNKGIILKTGPVDKTITSYTWTQDELSIISAQRPTNYDSHKSYKFKGWTYVPGSGQIDIPIDDDGKIDKPEGITIEEPKTDPNDPCEYGRHCLLLFPVFEPKPIHRFWVVFDRNAGGASGSVKVKYKNDPDGAWTDANSKSYYSTYTPATDGGSYTWKKEDLIVTAYETNPTSTATYEFLGWSTNKNATQPDEKYRVDENGMLLQDIELKAHDDDKPCDGKTHKLELFAVWRKTNLDTFRVVFGVNYQYGDAVSPNIPFWILQNGVKTQKQGSAGDRYTLPDGTSVSTLGRHLTYSHGPVPVGESSYTFPVSYWQERGLYAAHPSSSTTRYIFRGWSEDRYYYQHSIDPEYDPENLAPLYTVGEDGYIEQPITIEIPAEKVGKGGIWNKVLYAVWEPVTIHSYNLTFNGNGGQFTCPSNPYGTNAKTYTTGVIDAVNSSGGKTWDVDFWQENPMLGQPYSTGTTVYNFLGWAYSANATEPEIAMDEEGHILEPITVSEADPCTGGSHTLNVYAVWETGPNTRDYVLEYVGGSGITDMPDPSTERWTETYGATIPNAWVPNHTFNISTAVPKKQKYVFMGWSTTNGSGNAQYGYVNEDNYQIKLVTQHLEGKDTVTINAASKESGRTVKLYPVWWYGYEFIYDANGGVGAPVPDFGYANQSTYTYIVKDRIPEREGYKFLGWARKNSEGVIPDVPECSPNVGDYANDGYPDRITQACATSGSEAGYKTTTLYAIWEPITP